MITARENPFTAARIHALPYSPQGVSFEVLHERWNALGRRAAIVGSHGTGKSTGLKRLATDFEQQGFHVLCLTLNDEQTGFNPGELEALRALDTQTIVVLDGAEQLGTLGWFQFKRLTRKGGGVLITTHQSGRLPTLLQTQTSPDLLKQLLVALGVTGWGDEQIVRLFERFEGNIRDIFHHLYLHPESVLG